MRESSDDSYSEGRVWDEEERAFRLGGDQFAFDVVKKVAAPGTSFSKEALNQLIESMTKFVLVRTMEKWKASGDPPQHIRVTLLVAFPEDEEK